MFVHCSLLLSELIEGSGCVTGGCSGWVWTCVECSLLLGFGVGYQLPSVIIAWLIKSAASPVTPASLVLATSSSLSPSHRSHHITLRIVVL